MASPKLSDTEKKRIAEQVKELKGKEKVIETKEKVETRVERFIKAVRKPTKYDESKHIPLLFEIFEKGEGIADFCAEALICRDSFYEWLRVNPLFKKAYAIVIPLAQRRWEKMPLHYPETNFHYWQIIMKNRYGYGKPHITPSEDTTPKGRIGSIWKALEKGELSTHEANQLANLAMTEANIKVTEETGVSPHMVLTNEALRERVALLDKMIQHKEHEATDGK